MLDRSYATGCKFDKNRSVDITSKEEEIASLYIQYYGQPYAIDVQVERDGVWTTVLSAGQTYCEEWIELPQPAKKVRLLNTSGTTMCLAELYAYAAGDRPDSVHIWTVAEKADIMLLSAHPDDEILWFAGTIPTYAGERGLTVQLVYATCSTAERRLELLDGLWTCGCHTYPIFFDLRDRTGKKLESIYSLWGRENFYSLVTAAIRRCRP